MSTICVTLCDLPQFGCLFRQQHQKQQELQQSAELLPFLDHYCFYCNCHGMSSVPQGTFAAVKVRKNEEKYKQGARGFTECAEKLNFNYVSSSLSPLQYNSKLMNSVWGMYNRYSVHNLKKNIDGDLKYASVQETATSGPAGVGASQVESAYKHRC